MPLTTISMDRIPRERMGNATSLFNLMRNLGGSIGIAVTGTMLSRNTQAYVNVYGANVDVYSPATQRAFDAARGGFIAGGSDPDRDPARLRSAVRDGAAAGVDRVVRRALPTAWRDFPSAAAAGSADEASARRRPDGRSLTERSIARRSARNASAFPRN